MINTNRITTAMADVATNMVKRLDIPPSKRCMKRSGMINSLCVVVNTRVDPL